MPLTLLDIILLVVMLISGILAMVRGFMREVLSIASWIAAAIVTIYAYPRVLPHVKQYISHDLAASGVVIAGVFLGTLLIVSIVTIKISDMILDSRIGALDRTFGFLFGLARGLLIVVVAFMFFDWLVQPVEKQPEWVRNAKSRVVLQRSGDAIKSMLPEDPEGYLRRFRRPREGDEPAEPAPGTPAPATPAPGTPQRSQGGSAPSRTAAGQDDQIGYDRGDRAGMQRLLSVPPSR